MLLVTQVLVLWAILCICLFYFFSFAFFFHSENCFSWYWNHHFCATGTFFHWRGLWAGQNIERTVLCSFSCFIRVTLFFSVFVFVLFFLFCVFVFFFLRERQREWCCVVVHSKACLGFAVVTLTWSLKTASHTSFPRVGFPGYC